MQGKIYNPLFSDPEETMVENTPRIPQIIRKCETGCCGCGSCSYSDSLNKSLLKIGHTFFKTPQLSLWKRSLLQEIGGFEAFGLTALCPCPMCGPVISRICGAMCDRLTQQHPKYSRFKIEPLCSHSEIHFTSKIIPEDILLNFLIL